MPHDWIPIFRGPFPKALALRASLEASGVRTRVPDEVMKVMDPFITGLDPLSVEILVPWDDVELAKEVMAVEPKTRTGETAGAVTLDRVPDADAGGRLGRPAPPDAEALARKLRWCFVLPIYGWLMGSWVGFRYLLASREARLLPEGHGVTLLLWGAQCVLLSGTIALAFLL